MISFNNSTLYTINFPNTLSKIAQEKLRDEYNIPCFSMSYFPAYSPLSTGAAPLFYSMIGAAMMIIKRQVAVDNNQ